MNQCEKLDRRPIQTPNAKTVEKTINFWSENSQQWLETPLSPPFNVDRRFFWPEFYCWVCLTTLKVGERGYKLITAQINRV